MRQDVFLHIGDGICLVLHRCHIVIGIAVAGVSRLAYYIVQCQQLCPEGRVTVDVQSVEAVLKCIVEQQERVVLLLECPAQHGLRALVAVGRLEEAAGIVNLQVQALVLAASRPGQAAGQQQ